VSDRPIMERAGELARSGREQEAIRLVEQAAEAGDADAQHEVAQWRLFGIYGPRDHQATLRLLASARAKGHVPATRLEAVLVGNGSIAPADPARARKLLEQVADRDAEARAQLALLDAMPPLEAVEQLDREHLSADPPVTLVRNFLSPAECSYLTARASPQLQPSFVIDPRSGGRIPHPVRTSSGMNFGPIDEDLVIHALNRRIAAASGTAVENGELLQILRYDPGQEYRPHLDAVAGLGNQREWTLLVWLNDDYQGGETCFPELGITAKGKAGDALVFRNAGRDGDPDMRMRHAGAPVTSGTKWLASRWIRRSTFSPWEN